MATNVVHVAVVVIRFSIT